VSIVFMTRRLNTGRSHNTKIANKYFEGVINFRLKTTAACIKGIFGCCTCKELLSFLLLGLK